MKIRWKLVKQATLGMMLILLSGALISCFVWLCFRAMNWWTTTNAAAGVAVYESIAWLAIGAGTAAVILGIATLWLMPIGIGAGLAILGALLLLLNLWLQVGYTWHGWYWWLILAAGIITVISEVLGAISGWRSWPPRLRSLDQVYETAFGALLWSGGSVLVICIILGYFPSLCVAISLLFI